MFLFGARDVWFVVALPVFFASNLGWSFDEIGSFMAVWVIGYGIVQAFVPRLSRKTKDTRTGADAAHFWGYILFLLPAAITSSCLYFPDQITPILIVGLMGFGVVFAINSSLHSYLIIAYSDEDKVSLSVGFYYMANAVGRLFGTLLSGLVYQAYGLEACLAASALLVLISTLSVSFLNKKPTLTS